MLGIFRGGLDSAGVAAPGPDRWLSASAPGVFLGWLVIAIFRYAHHITYNFPAAYEAFALTAYYLFDALRWAVFTLFVLWFVRRCPAASTTRLKLWTVIAPLLIASAVVMLFIDGIIFSMPVATPLGVAWPKALFDLTQKRFHRMLLDVTTVCIVAYGLSMQRALAEEALRSARLEAAVTKARLTALTQQLHPHLLFNTLNSISALIHRQPDMAERMVARLGDLLRAALRIGSRSTITLREDLAFAEAYLRIHQHHFLHGLRVATDVDASLLDAAVPPLVIQPLVENSLKHGLDATAEAPVISIKARIAEGDLLVVVGDPGRSPNALTEREGFGVGLGQIRERLEGLYGPAASIELSTSSRHGSTVSVRLPLQYIVEAATVTTAPLQDGPPEDEQFFKCPTPPA